MNPRARLPNGADEQGADGRRTEDVRRNRPAGAPTPSPETPDETTNSPANPDFIRITDDQ